MDADDRELHGRVPRQRRGTSRPDPTDEDDRLVEAARHDRLPPDDADPLVRLLAALRAAGVRRGGEGR
jgi:hypothetical protein